MKRFQNGLIVGKFSPLHKGHEFLIREAVKNCEKVWVLSYSSPEFSKCEAEVRKGWFNELFPDINLLVLDPGTFERKCGFSMPRNDDSATIQRQFVAKVWLSLVNQPLNAVFTSESYGEGFADELARCFSSALRFPKVEHVLVDIERKTIPVSGSVIRKDPHSFRHFLSPAVYSSFIERICFLGGESTGKSTLARLLAERYGTRFVEEYGRELWEEKAGALEFDDLLQIGKIHVEREKDAAREAHRYLFVDSSPLTTFIYSYNLFGRVDHRLERLSRRSYDRIFLCAPDFPFVQDGTRKSSEFSQMQHDQHLRILEERNVGFTLLEGSIEERIGVVERYLNEPTKRPSMAHS